METRSFLEHVYDYKLSTYHIIYTTVVHVQSKNNCLILFTVTNYQVPSENVNFELIIIKSYCGTFLIRLIVFYRSLYAVLRSTHLFYT